MKKTKKQLARESWISETQMFQRIAKVEESSTEELGAEWDLLYSRKSMAAIEVAVDNIKIHRAIIEMARKKREN